MDMHQKRKMRQEKKNNQQNIGVAKNVINWEITTYEKLPRKAYK